jgi:hypothetical protein
VKGGGLFYYKGYMSVRFSLKAFAKSWIVLAVSSVK